MAKPKLRFKEFFGEWEEKKLEELGTFKNGLNKTKEDFGFGMPFVNLMDVFGKDVVKPKNLGLINANKNDLKIYNLIKGDILFIRSSVKKEGVGQTVLVLNNLKNTTYSGFLIRFRENSSKLLNLIFKKYCFKTTKFRNNLISLSTTSANTNINQESLNKLKINIPTKPEQEKIATFLSSIDKKIELQEKKLKLLKSYKKGLMQKIFSQELRFKDDDGNDFLEWKVKKLGEVCKLQNGFAFKSSLFKNEGVPIIRISNISNSDNFIDTSNLVFYNKININECYVLQEGDLIIAMSGATTGKASIYNLKKKAYLNQRVGVFRNKCQLSYQYLTQIVFSSIFYRQLEIVLVSGAQPNISSIDIEKFKIPIPLLEEQNKIANFLSNIDKKIEISNKELKLIKEFKKGLLQNMFV